MTARRQSLGRLYLDLIRDGANVDGCDGDEHDRQVQRALVRSAMSAAQCGQQFDEWMVLVRESISRLGQQARRKGGRHDRSTSEFNQLLLDAWATAEKRIAERPTMTAEDRAEHIAVVRAFCADADAKITDSERAVLDAACTLAERYGTIRPALSWRKVQEVAGLSERATKGALASLSGRGLLTLHRRGSAAVDPRRRRASVYYLPSASALATHAGVPYTPRGLTYGTSTAPMQAYGTPAQIQMTPKNDDDEETAVVTLTISANDPEAIAAAIDALRRSNPAVAVEPELEPERAEQRGSLSVIPGGRDTRRRSA